MEKQVNISPLRMIRIAKDLTMEEMAENFMVTNAYISALEKGKRSINFRTLKFGLDNLGISVDDFVDLKEFGEKLINDDISDQDKFKFMLIKASGVVYPELKEQYEQLINEFYYKKVKRI